MSADLQFGMHLVSRTCTNIAKVSDSNAIPPVGNNNNKPWEPFPLQKHCEGLEKMFRSPPPGNSIASSNNSNCPVYFRSERGHQQTGGAAVVNCEIAPLSNCLITVTLPGTLGNVISLQWAFTHAFLLSVFTPASSCRNSCLAHNTLLQRLVSTGLRK